MKMRYWSYLVFLMVAASLALAGCGNTFRGGPGTGPRGPMSSSGSSQWTSSSSSGTSGCPWGYECPYAAIEPTELQYVQQNRDRLLEEVSQGTGSHLTAMAQLKGCSLEEASSFSFLLKDNFSTFLNPAGSEEKIQPDQFLFRIETLLKENPTLAHLCQDGVKVAGKF